MWRELRTAAENDLVVPEVVSERCVHARMERASCSACVDACPRNAWVIDEEMLGIDADKCDGCELCVPACPQGAIEARFSPSLRTTDRGGVAFAVCEQAIVARQDAGFMPCLHALGMTDLLRLRRDGADLLVTSCGDCERCERGGAKRLGQRLVETNRLLTSRGLKPLRHRSLDAGTWEKAYRQVSELAASRPLDRRTFFRNALRMPQERLEAAIDDAVTSFVPPGMLLDSTAPDALFPFVPQIAAERCNGCDACVRLCPQEAIQFEIADHGAAAFVLRAERCSGCGICTDVCEREAVSIRSLSQSPACRISLRAGRCAACGTDFHVPVTAWDGEPLCWVCRTTNHHRNLYQVLK